jgi:hypothetical protein
MLVRSVGEYAPHIPISTGGETMEYAKLALTLLIVLFALNVSAGPKDCEVNYVLDNAGTITTGWINLGEVGGLLANKKKLCKERAIAHCAEVKAKLLVYAPVGSANMQSICDQGKVTVYFDSKVEGKINSKDGTCSTPVQCTRSPCPWTGYAK